MTTTHLCSFVGFLGLCATQSAGALQGRERQREAAVTEVKDVTVEARSAGTWAVRVVRQDESRSKDAAVIVRSEQKPSPPDPVHVRLAGARAWLALAEDRVAAKEWKAVVALARKGLDELGREYAQPQIEDDSDMKAFAAEDQLAQGKAENAAHMLTGVLATRIILYVSLHNDTVVEVSPPVQD
jgi:hypothetical protein